MSNAQDKDEHNEFIRLANPDDLPELSDLVEEFCKQSPHSLIPYDNLRLQDNILLALQKSLVDRVALVAFHNDELVGYLFASCQLPLFSSHRVAIEEGLYLKPSARKTKLGDGLRKCYEEWAKEVAKVNYVCFSSAGYDPRFDKMMHRKGYTTLETGYIKWL